MKRREFILGTAGVVGCSLGRIAGAQVLPCPPPTVRADGSATATTACESASWAPPYSLPSSGQTIAIGVNNAMSVVPTDEGWDTGGWDYSNFGSYGGGVFVPVFSKGGAWVAAGTGGHNHADNHGALLFDFEDATWKRIDNANGVVRKSATPYSYRLSETNGAPYHEIGGSPVPAPGHPYALNNFLPQGPRGAVILVTRAALAVESVESRSVHVFDLSSRQWSRFSDSLSDRAAVESDSVYDDQRGRYWLVMLNQGDYTNVAYLDIRDRVWKLTAKSATQPSSINGYCRTWMHDGLLMRQGASGQLFFFDPDSPSAGWGQCAVSGSMPPADNSFVRFSNGNYYHKGTAAGNTLHRLVPPTNPKAGTWIADTITVGGPTLPGYDITYAQGRQHYKNLIYVPSIGCLAWISGGNRPVYLIRPSS